VIQLTMLRIRRSDSAKADDALTPFETACTLTGLKPGRERFAAFFALPEDQQRVIWQAAEMRAQARRERLAV
jgi:hypothetical protein